MRRKMRKRGKMMALTLSAVVAVSAVMAGTYAWRSVSQKALNEAKGNLNPGGRLHDDFNGLNLSSAQTTDAGETERKVKYVYVENFTEEENGDQIYARIRLDEYLETGVGAGKPTGDASKMAQPLVVGTTIENKSTWTTYKWDDAPLFRNYVTLSTGGDTVYLPTFNKDRDSLEADINGTLGGLDKNIKTESDDYSDYVKYTYDAANDTNTSKVKSIEIYDADGQERDAVKEAGLTAEKIIEAVRDPQTGRFNVSPTAQTIQIDGLTCTIEKMEPETLNGSSSSSDITAIYLDLDPVATGESPHADIILRAAEHSAKKTLDTLNALDGTNTPGVISMEEWENEQQMQPGNYWVYDSEGWLYWANPIDPETATGCLLNSIAINDTTTEGQTLQNIEYYYGLNVVAQFATAGDWGDKTEKTGFYKDGMTPEAEDFLATISGEEPQTGDYRVSVKLTDVDGKGADKSNITQESVLTYEATVQQVDARAAVEVGAEDITWTVTGNSDESTTWEKKTATTFAVTLGEKEESGSIRVSASYQNPTDQKSTEKAVSVGKIEKTTYEMEISVDGSTTVYPGARRALTATAKKTNGPKKDETAEVTDVEWTLTGAKSQDTKVSENTLIIGADEEVGELTLTASGVGVNGTTVGTLQAIKFVVEELTPEQADVKNALVGEKVTIGDLQFWKIYEGVEQGTEKKVALLWQVEPEENYRRTAFSTMDPKWSTSQTRSYLSKNGTYVSDHLKIKEMINAGIIPEATIYTRGAYNDKTDSSKQTTQDYVFLLSAADLDGRVISGGSSGNYSYDTSPAEFEYTTYGMTGSGTQLLINLSNKTTILRHINTNPITWTWLRSPCCNTYTVEDINYEGAFYGNIIYSNSDVHGGVRPAFWIYI